MAEHAGEPVKVSGIHGVQNFAWYAVKVTSPDGCWIRIRNAAQIGLIDISFINLENRIDNEMKTLDGCRVMATGELIIPTDPFAEPVMARPDSMPKYNEITQMK